MYSKTFLTGLIITLVLVSACSADDIIRISGSPNKRVQVQSATYDEIKFKSPSLNMAQRADSAEVARVVYSAAPGLKVAHSLLGNGRYTEAEAKFKQVTGSDFLTEEGDFGIALVGYTKFLNTGLGGDQSISGLEKYLSEYRAKKGFHVPEALYILADSYIKNGAPDKADAPLTELLGFKGESRQSIAKIGKGQVALAKGSASEASSIFNTSLRTTKRNNFEKFYKLSIACRGKALVAEKRLDDAIQFLEKETKSAKGSKVEFDRFSAQAFNVLGSAYAAKGDSASQWKALYSYLWTTTIFRHCRAESAQAFYEAAVLSKKLGETADAARLESKLKSLYADTKWAKKVN